MARWLQTLKADHRSTGTVEDLLFKAQEVIADQKNQIESNNQLIVSLNNSLNVWILSHNKQREDFLTFLRLITMEGNQMNPHIRLKIEDYIHKLLK